MAPRRCGLRPGLEGGGVPALGWQLLALPESRGAPKRGLRWSKNLAPGKTPLQARQRVGLTGALRSARLASRRSCPPAGCGRSERRSLHRASLICTVELLTQKPRLGSAFHLWLAADARAFGY